ncbi:hypothetical protein HNY73_019989 [Argiope bruennichi]|uniref:Uncharacterized protein n=1 Tax=Argiope bruennichi TaxID=94029 RepID=A0A8T0E9S5_ARGBR|nr:hypothetical protein HNY73_019989 [Argiope bruennichi]
MNSSCNVSPTTSTSSQSNDSSSLADQNISASVNTGILTPSIAREIVRNLKLQLGAFNQGTSSSMMPAPSPPGQDVQQLNSPFSPSTSHQQMNARNSPLYVQNSTPSPPSERNYLMHSPNMTVNSSRNRRNQTPSPNSHLHNNSFLMAAGSSMMPAPSPPGQDVQQLNSPFSPSTSHHQMNAPNSPLYTQNSSIMPVPSPRGQDVQQLNSLFSPSTSHQQMNAPNSPPYAQNSASSPSSERNYLTVNSPRNPSSQSPSSSLKMQDLFCFPRTSASSHLNPRNQSPSSSSSMNYPMSSSNFASNSPPLISSDLPSLTAPFQSLQLAQSSSAEASSLYASNSLMVARDPPPYSAATQNNQPGVTYTELSSAQPYDFVPNSSAQAASSAPSGFAENDNSYWPIYHEEFDEKTDLPALMSVDEGLGTSPETSPGQQSQSSPSFAYGDDSLNASYNNNVSRASFINHIEPQREPARECRQCGRDMTLRGGCYDCDNCNEMKPKKRKKKAQE